MLAFRIFLTIVLYSCFWTHFAIAEEYPVKPIRLIVGFPPGGNADFLARVISQKLGEIKGWFFILENRPGATGTIANGFLAKSAPDGYTIGVVTGSSLTAAPHLMKVLYGLNDLTPVLNLAVYPAVLVCHPSVPAKTVRQLIVVAKNKPGILTFGSAGIGNTFHLAGEELSSMAGIRLLHIPYKGAGPALTDLVAGRIDLMFNSVMVVRPFINNGKIRAIAVTGSKRDSLLPGIPTVRESVPGYEVNAWIGLFAPKGTPTVVVERLNGEISKILQDQDMKEKWKQNGYSFVPGEPEEFSRFVKKEDARFGALIKNLSNH